MLIRNYNFLYFTIRYFGFAIKRIFIYFPHISVGVEKDYICLFWNGLGTLELYLHV